MRRLDRFQQEMSSSFPAEKSLFEITMQPFITAVIVLSALLLASCNQTRRAEEQRSRTESPAPARSPDIHSYADIVDRVAPAVVTIRSSRRVRDPRQYPFAQDPFFEEFFGRRFRGAPQPQERLQRGLGSGVVVRDDGHLVTNHHVIDGAQEIRVEFANGTSHDAKLIGSDPPSDLAVLKVQPSGLKALPIGNSDQVRVGDIVLAIGNPLGVGQTVTGGIISAKGRTTGLSDGSFEDFLQTDAPINQGNSGGALVNTAGELIGINSQILSPSGGNIGIGFAIPANMMRDVLDQLVKDGRVRRGVLGVTVQPLTPDLASAFKLKDHDGVLVSDVQTGSAAERAGIRRGDVITGINGEKVESTNRLRNLVSSLQPGTEVKVTVVREGKPSELSVKLGELQASQAANNPTAPSAEAQGNKLGIAVQPLTAALASELGIGDAVSGLLIRNVDPSGPGAEAGLTPGDVIVQVNRVPVRTVAELEKIVDAAGSESFPLLINRRGRTFFVVVEPR